MHKHEADNCPRENKNNNVIKFMSWLVSSQRMRVTSMLFSRVGHTHNALGFLDNMFLQQVQRREAVTTIFNVY